MSMLLSIAFCSAITCEEYIVDHNLTRSDCIERMQEERKALQGSLMSFSVEKAYQKYMESFKAEHMNGKAKSWEINCVPEVK